MTKDAEATAAVAAEVAGVYATPGDGGGDACDNGDGVETVMDEAVEAVT